MPAEYDSSADEMEAMEAFSEDERNVDLEPSRNKKMANAISKILSSTDTNQPILSQNKGLEKAIDDEKLEGKAKRILAAQRKELDHLARVIPTHEGTDYEKKLRKVGTRGGIYQSFIIVKIDHRWQVLSKETSCLIFGSTALSFKVSF